MVHVAIEVLSKILCISLLLFQGIMMDAYLSMLYNSMWWSWVIGDVIILIVWTSILIIVRKHFMEMERKKKLDFVDGRDPEQSPDEIKYAYIAWICYVVFLCPRLVLLFKDVAKTLEEKDILGPNFLKMSVSCTPLIFLLLVYGFHNSRPQTSRQLSIQSIAAAGALDLFDSIDLLDFLFIPEEEINFPVAYLHATLGFACANLFLPVLSLYGLSFKTSSGRVSSLFFKILNVGFNLLLVNIPNMVIRSVLWHAYSLDVSVLLMKNVMCIFLGFYEMFEYYGEYRPVSCKVCKSWFEITYYHKHKSFCQQEEDVQLEVISESQNFEV